MDSAATMQEAVCGSVQSSRPRGHGGRPRTQWTPSRRRRAVRLYLMTTLRVKDIGQVLSEDGFQPCKRDIEVKITQMLQRRPKSFSQSRCRVSSHLKLVAHWDQIRRCRSGRITKNRDPVGKLRTRVLEKAKIIASGSGDMVSFRTTDETGPNEVVMQDCEGPVRDCYPSNTPLFSNWSSSLTSPCLLKPPKEHSYAAQLSDLPVWTTEDLPLGPEAEEFDTSAESLKNRDVARSTIHPKRSARVTSLNRLQTLLGNSYSKGQIEHVSSVLRYSSTDSWRSSLFSITSSQRWSDTSSLGRRSAFPAAQKTLKPAVAAPKVFSISKPFKKLASSKFPLLPPDEQEVWDELIDEEKLSQTGPESPAEEKDTAPIVPESHSKIFDRWSYFSETSLKNRQCCSNKPHSCSCGYADAHYYASLGNFEILGTTKALQINQQDRFNNTPLHYAAAAGLWGFLPFKLMIGKGADEHATNTFGETFLHVLDFGGLKSVGSYINLLKFLRDRQFPFSRRNHRGQTIGHTLFKLPCIQKFNQISLLEASNVMKSPCTPKFDQSSLVEALNVMKIDLDTSDNQGRTIRYLLRACHMNENGIEHQQGQAHADPNFVEFKPYSDFRSTLKHGDWTIRSFLEWAKDTGKIGWVDENGDTPLMAIVKMWKVDKDDQSLGSAIQALIVDGVEIEAQDRRGCTILAIAARRGLRSVTEVLLVAGANPNACSYSGKSVLQKATETTWLAMKKDMLELYGRVLSCIAILGDYGAMANPDVRLQWSSPAALAVDKERERLRFRLKDGGPVNAVQSDRPLDGKR